MFTGRRLALPPIRVSSPLRMASCLCWVLWRFHNECLEILASAHVFLSLRKGIHLHEILLQLELLPYCLKCVQFLFLLERRAQWRQLGEKRQTFSFRICPNYAETPHFIVDGTYVARRTSCHSHNWQRQEVFQFHLGFSNPNLLQLVNK